jgi:hypothetical protein
MLADIDRPLRFEYREIHTRTIAALRMQIDETTFVALWSEGKAMSLAQALVYTFQASS